MIAKFLLIAAMLAAPVAALAAPPAPLSRVNIACHVAVRHVSLLEAQMCPQPLATTVIAMPRHRTLHT
jgi:hypothetical protein